MAQVPTGETGGEGEGSGDALRGIDLDTFKTKKYVVALW